MKQTFTTLTIFFIFLPVFLYSQNIENVQIHAPSNFVSGTSPDDPDFYVWETIDDLTQGVNIDMIKPEIRDIIIQSNNVKLAFNILGASNPLIKLDINYDDNGWETIFQVGNGVEKSFSVGWIDPPPFFQSVGTHNLKLNYTSIDGNTKLREYNIIVIPSCQGFYRDNTKSPEPSIFSTGNTLTLWDESGNPNAKPVIVSEGFDPSNGSYPEFYRWKGSFLSSELADEGYKIYILNYNFGSQSLRNNSAVLHSAIEYISQINEDQDVMLIGISMGGVIGRYTLAKADEEGNSLPVSLFASLDAPQQGAVIDSKFQDFVEKEIGDFPALNNDAAKELLIYNTFDEDGNIHNDFYDELNSLNGDGYPTSVPTIGAAFSRSPNPNGGDKWLNVEIDIINDGEFYVENEWSLTGSFLPLSATNLDPMPFPGWWNFLAPFGANTEFNRLSDPTFIPYRSALDIVGAKAKTCLPIFLRDDEAPSYHDEVPLSIVDGLINILQLQKLNEIASDEVYNFTPIKGHYLLGDLTINGEMHLNRSDGFSGSSKNPEPQDIVIDYDLRTTSCLPVDIIVEEEAKLIIGQGPNQQGNLFLEENSTLVVKPGGLLNAVWGSKIYVEPGASLRIQSGGILRIVHYSDLIVQEGGQLIIDDGAIIQLWDGGPSTDGDANIQIHGELVLNGQFEFGGSGFFTFYDTHKLTFAEGIDEFVLNGRGKRVRFIRIDDTQLDFGGRTLRLSNGKVEYSGSSSLTVYDGGKALLQNMEFRGINNTSSSYGVNMLGTEKVDINNCDFYDLKRAIYCNGINNPTGTYRLNDSNINNCKEGAWVWGMNNFNFFNVQFNGGPESEYAIWGVQVNNCYVSHGKINNYNSSNTAGSVILDDVTNFQVRYGELSNNTVGISVPYGSQSNVFLNRGTRLIGNGIGVDMVKGGLGGNLGEDYGLVHVDCARFIDNGVAIQGEDVLLEIDAIENCLGCPPYYARRNQFEGGNLFSICYQDRDITEISAHGNYWGGDINAPFPNQFRLRNGLCNSSFNNVVLDASNPSLLEPLGSCDGGQSIGGNITPVKICVLTMGSNNYLLHQQYKEAYKLFRKDSLDLSRTRFKPIAAIPDQIRSQASVVCKQYIDIARVMTNINTDPKSKTAGKRSWEDFTSTLNSSF